MVDSVNATSPMAMTARQTGGATTTGSATSGSAFASSDFETFLKMLTTQMKNQDPLNPMDSSNYAAQLAAFSGVEQQVKTNQLLSDLTAQLGVSGMGQFASWVGMEARSTAPVVFRGSPLTLYPTPDAKADQAFLVAYDSTGKAVSRQQVALSGDPVNWTGTGPGGGQLMNGIYSFRLESYAAGKLLSDSKVESFGQVTEIRHRADGTRLVMASGGEVLPSEVSALRPGTP